MKLQPLRYGRVGKGDRTCPLTLPSVSHKGDQYNQGISSLTPELSQFPPSQQSMSHSRAEGDLQDVGEVFS